MAIEDSEIDDVFDYHQPTENQVQRITALRVAAKRFALALYENCPQSADRTSALRHLRLAMMEGNASIVLNGKGLR